MSFSINIKKSSRFYYNTLNLEQRRVYNTLKKTIELYESHAVINVSDGSKISDFLMIPEYVENDNPLLYYLSNADFELMKDHAGNHLLIECNYDYLKEEVEDNLKRIKNKVEDIYYSFLSDKSNEYDKEKSLHDYLIKTIIYHKKAPELQKNEYNIIGPLFSGYGVCKGIAQVMNLVMNSIGIKCSTITGYSKINNEKHAWNIIRINGNNYHLDATWDISLSNGLPQYDYFNLSDSFCTLDHKWAINTNCDVDYENYFVKNGLDVDDQKDIDGKLELLKYSGDHIALRIINKKLDPGHVICKINFNALYKVNEEQKIIFIERK